MPMQTASMHARILHWRAFQHVSYRVSCHVSSDQNCCLISRVIRFLLSHTTFHTVSYRFKKAKPGHHSGLDLGLRRSPMELPNSLTSGLACGSVWAKTILDLWAGLKHGPKQRRAHAQGPRADQIRRTHTIKLYEIPLVKQQIVLEPRCPIL